MKTIFNPLSEDFSTKYDMNEDGRPVTYTIRAMEMAEFEDVVADHMTKHLATHIFHKRGVKNNPESDLAEITKEIETDL